MSKRYTDSDKWDDPWFQDLLPEHKIAWVFLCDKCSWAGIWKVSPKSFEMYTGTTFCRKEIIDIMGGRVLEIGDGSKWFIKGFVRFQQGDLKTGSRFHDSIIRELKENDIDENLKPLTSPLLGSNKTVCNVMSSNGNGNGNGNGNNAEPELFSEELPNNSRTVPKKIDFDEILMQYHTTCKSLPAIKLLTDTRKKLIKSRSADLEKLETTFDEFFALVASSDFLCGRTPSGWTASFDWILNALNFAKIVDGNYKNKKPTVSQQPPVMTRAEAIANGIIKD